MHNLKIYTFLKLGVLSKVKFLNERYQCPKPHNYQHTHHPLSRIYNGGNHAGQRE